MRMKSSQFGILEKALIDRGFKKHDWGGIPLFVTKTSGVAIVGDDNATLFDGDGNSVAFNVQFNNVLEFIKEKDHETKGPRAGVKSSEKDA